MHAPRRSFRKLATYATLSLALVACAKKYGGDAGDNRPSAVDKPPPALADVSKETTKNDAKDGKGGDQMRPRDNRKIIRTGRLDLVIENYDAAREKLELIVKGAGGFVDSTQVSHHKGSVGEATIVLRIPSDAFATIVPKLRELGEIASESTSADDITAQYVDLSARLTSAKTLEKRLLELAAERTGNVENLLAVERELARVRGEVEGYEGQIRQWNDQVAMSTLTLGLSTREPVVAADVEPEPSLGERVSHGFSSPVDALRSFGASLAVAFVAFLPWLIFLVPSAILGRRLWRRYHRKLPRAVTVAQPAVAQPAAAAPESPTQSS